MKTFEYYDSEVSQEATRLYRQHWDAAMRAQDAADYAQRTAEKLHELHDASGFATEGETADNEIAKEFGKLSLKDQEEQLESQSRWVATNLDTATRARRDYATQLKTAEEHYKTHQAEYHDAAKEWDKLREASK